jgi:hypothetical protein
LPSSDQIRRKSACGDIHKTASTGFIEALVRADIRVYENPPDVQSDIFLIGYMLGIGTGAVARKEVR